MEKPTHYHEILDPLKELAGMAINGLRRVVLDHVVPPNAVAGAFMEEPEEARGSGPLLDRELYEVPEE